MGKKKLETSLEKSQRIISLGVLAKPSHLVLSISYIQSPGTSLKMGECYIFIISVRQWTKRNIGRNSLEYRILFRKIEGWKGHECSFVSTTPDLAPAFRLQCLPVGWLVRRPAGPSCEWTAEEHKWRTAGQELVIQWIGQRVQRQLGGHIWSQGKRQMWKLS